MNKSTGRIFTLEEFNLLKKCTYCGKANDKSVCEECILVDFKKCKNCEIILRTYTRIAYRYDICSYVKETKYKLPVFYKMFC